MAYINSRFPENVALGASGGPEYSTNIVKLRSGREFRNTTWTYPKRRYDVGLGIRGVEDLYDLNSHILLAKGMLNTFAFKDWSDYKSSGNPLTTITNLDQPLGIGDGVEKIFDIVKVYGDQTRRITKPVVSTVIVALDGVEVEEYGVDLVNGRVFLPTAPSSGQVLTCGFEFDVECRFDSDYTPITLSQFNSGMVSNIDIVEVRSDISDSFIGHGVDLYHVFGEVNWGMPVEGKSSSSLKSSLNWGMPVEDSVSSSVTVGIYYGE